MIVVVRTYPDETTGHVHKQNSCNWFKGWVLAALRSFIAWHGLSQGKFSRQTFAYPITGGRKTCHKPT